MKLRQALFSIAIILIQLIITIISYMNYRAWVKSLENIDSPICSFGWSGGELFLAVLILAFFEITSRKEWIKGIIQVLLALIVFVQIGPSDIRNDFYEIMEVTALVSAFFVFLFLLVRFIRVRYQ